ncbi:hypothetical protein DFJ43DRAFT_1064380 [Lentinula guzmanii]|uniref:Uncharacterized protein n=1 Tax=Lentinula guzmanii TaxID=2804957 RepID=A0AA38JWP7_9AGAR|nr:hypothetical protein DFJ43DRAFT_1064380 [Lentinula guzmanii]
MFLSNSISYFLIGLVALTWQAAAAPITQREVAAQVPTNAASTPVNVIHGRFTGELGGNDQSTKPTVDSKIDHEVHELFKAYLKSIGITTSFEIQYEDGSKDPITLASHNFDFWGENVGDDCKEEQDLPHGKKGCMVAFNRASAGGHIIDAGKEWANVIFDEKNLFALHYDIDNQQVLAG